ncbi:hypothetical protein OsI_25853 [Oryza sativa Indica Group]|uniref:Uncharacterized protein n=1 Tax=Oryza sativa subsp. indica TaxID=39946 RepID=A2YKW0_ORYSI|nr:hypothetical protein OsI_25853 [Oryza sativa Indica Group]
MAALRLPPTLRDLERGGDGNGDDEPAFRPHNAVSIDALRAANLEAMAAGWGRGDDGAEDGAEARGDDGAESPGDNDAEEARCDDGASSLPPSAASSAQPPSSTANAPLPPTPATAHRRDANHRASRGHHRDGCSGRREEGEKEEEE